MLDGDMELSISQIAAQIVAQVTSLESVRQKSFLEWLQAHSSQAGGVKQSRPEITTVTQNEESFEARLKKALIIWFEFLPAAGVLWEYRLILSELAWWRALDGQLLALIMDKTDRA